MPFTNKIILISEHPATRELVEAALASGGLGALTLCRNLTDLTARHLNNGEAALVLVDLDPPGMGLLDQLEPLITAHPHSRFIVLTAQRTPLLIERAMQSGVRHLQLKSEIPQELMPVARALLGALGKDGTGRGKLLTLLSTGGGCGATTLALNLALALQARGQKRVLLIDGDLDYGSLGAYLVLENRYGLAEILNHNTPPDSVLLESTVAHYPGGLEVLLGPDALAPGHGERPASGQFAALLEVCRHVYSAAVLDLPRPPREWLLAAARCGGPLLLVMQSAVKDFRTAFALYRLLTGNGVSRARIVLAVNRYDRRHCPVPLKEIENAFGGSPILCLRNDYASAERALAEGKPLLLRFPRSPLARDVEQLAQICLDLNHAPRGETIENAYD